MPSVNDIITTTWVQELAGVAVTNVMHWQVTDLGDNPPIATALQALATQYWNTVTGVLTAENSLTCVVYENRTAPEGVVRQFLTGLVGTALGSAHPQNQVLRINLWAQDDPADEIAVGAFNLTGVTETDSTRGRVNDVTLFDLAVDFMKDPVVVATHWTLQPFLQSTTLMGRHVGLNDDASLVAPGGTFVPGTLNGLRISNRNDRSKGTVVSNTDSVVTGALSGGTDNNWDVGDRYGIGPVDPYWIEIIQAQLNPTFRTIRRRTTKLCAGV